MKALLIQVDRDINLGWIKNILGIDRPSDALEADGWDMAEETYSRSSPTPRVATKMLVTSGGIKVREIDE